MNRPMRQRDVVLAIVGIVVGLFASWWVGLALVLLAILLHFAAPGDGRGA